MAETLAELRSLSDEEIIRRHDSHAAGVGVATVQYLTVLPRADEAP